MAKKNDKKGGINPKQTQAAERMNFLHQASILMSTIKHDIPKEENKKIKKSNVKGWSGDPEGRILGIARYLNNNMKQISNKIVLRVDPSIKRSICKRCETPLLPISTANVRAQSKPAQSIIYTCKICKAKKTFNTNNSKYELFSEREDIVLREDQD